MARVEIVYFNPRRRVLRGRVGRLVPLRRPVNNFGDLLGPIVVDSVLRNAGLRIDAEVSHPSRLLTVGSILHLARSGDVVWGSGRNGKVRESAHSFAHLDVRAVRGPLTRSFLTERGLAVPEIYGDPALLLPRVMPHLRQWAMQPVYDVTYVPNMNDYHRAERGSWLLSPRSALNDCLQRIARSRLVVGSSLHALVVAEALGIPARAVRSRVETEFKYADYYLGTGRSDFRIASTPEEAVRWGGERPVQFSEAALLQAFPLDLWTHD